MLFSFLYRSWSALYIGERESFLEKRGERERGEIEAPFGYKLIDLLSF